ncbi:MAG: alpha-glucosidase [Oscillospiraceae bacterium]|jgi:oligo-1,6-glucosidase|nr:alpha-glucosidase [Oscillospiraceae bacterium]
MKTHWYRDAVIYQVYPRSFADGNGDGVGDILGLISKLDYLHELGVDAVWLSPCYPSPNDDNGYDISDYRGIMPEFGTMDDWLRLRDGLHARGMRLVMDLVVNHTSDEHPWFVESRKGRDSPYRDYYIWRDGLTSGASADKRPAPPNGWRACFGGSAWQWDTASAQYYLHLYSVKQPDLNWKNPAVRQEVADICNYWLALGVDGFRCDVIPQVGKELKVDGDARDANICAGGWYDYMRELGARSWHNYDTLVVGECVGIDASTAPKIHGAGSGLLDSVISFDHLPWINRHYSLRKFKRELHAWQSMPDSAWWSPYWENHDQHRSPNRFAAKRFHGQASRCLLTIELFFRGTPYIYQGQELGMTDIPLRADEFRDIQSVNMLRDAKNPVVRYFKLRHLRARARDHARTPMQWSAEKNAGFSTAKPWMKVNPNYVQINAAAQLADPDSVLQYTKKLLRVRKNYTHILRHATYADLLPKHPRFYCYTQSAGDKTLLVIALFKGTPLPFRLPKALRGKAGRLVISNNPQAPETLRGGWFKPFEVRVYTMNN